MSGEQTPDARIEAAANAILGLWLSAAHPMMRKSEAWGAEATEQSLVLAETALAAADRAAPPAQQSWKVTYTTGASEEDIERARAAVIEAATEVYESERAGAAPPAPPDALAVWIASVRKKFNLSELPADAPTQYWRGYAACLVDVELLRGGGTPYGTLREAEQ